MENVDNIKIGERYPKFGFGDLLDEILEEFGGVLDIFRCEWDENTLDGEVVCLMKDWRVFQYHLKQNEMAALSRVDRIKVINRDCFIFEDVDNWCMWKESEYERELKVKKQESNKNFVDKNKEQVNEYISDLNDFFNGDFEKIQKKMQKNHGV